MTKTKIDWCQKTIEGRMYLKLEGVKGDVVEPHVYRGQMLAQMLQWPGGCVLGHPTGSARNREAATEPKDKNAVPNFDDFRNLKFYVDCKGGSHTAELLKLSYVGVDPLEASIWIPYQPRPLWAVLKGVTVDDLVRQLPDRGEGGDEIDHLTLYAKSGKLRFY